MAIRTTCSGVCAGVLRLVALALLADSACNSAGLHLTSGSHVDGSTNSDTNLDVVPIPIADVADDPANDTTAVIPASIADVAIDQADDAMDTLPQCCSGPETLSPVATATPCSFVVSAPPPYPDQTAVYLNKYLVYQDQLDGWSFGPTTSTIVFTGTSCDTITSSPQQSVVQMLCSCHSPVPKCCLP